MKIADKEVKCPKCGEVFRTSPTATPPSAVPPSAPPPVPVLQAKPDEPSVQDKPNPSKPSEPEPQRVVIVGVKIPFWDVMTVVLYASVAIGILFLLRLAFHRLVGWD
jgi:hypothetical protein